MRIAILKHGLSVILTLGLALAGVLTGSAQATVFETSASLPLIGVAYVSPSGAGCFIVGVCVTPGPFVLTSATSSFDVTGQEIMANAVYGAVLTLPPPAPDTPIGSVALTGTVDETVLGRTSDSETGSFNTLITGLQLTGNLVLPGSSLDGATLLANSGRFADIGRNDDHHAGRQFVQDRQFLRRVYRRLDSGHAVQQVRHRADPAGRRRAGALDLGVDADRLRRPRPRRLAPRGRVGGLTGPARAGEGQAAATPRSATAPTAIMNFLYIVVCSWYVLKDLGLFIARFLSVFIAHWL